METSKSLGKINAAVLADYILLQYNPMPHLKLQKLLYYCEAYHLAYLDESLLYEDFQAWVHGPVCREVFNILKDESVLHSDVYFQGNYEVTNIIEQQLNYSQQDLLDDVLESLTPWTASELENATHNEEPWIEARKGFGPVDKCDKIISKETMKRFYKLELYGPKA